MPFFVWSRLSSLLFQQPHSPSTNTPTLTLTHTSPMPPRFVAPIAPKCPRCTKSVYSVCLPLPLLSVHFLFTRKRVSLTLGVMSEHRFSHPAIPVQELTAISLSSSSFLSFLLLRRNKSSDQTVQHGTRQYVTLLGNKLTVNTVKHTPITSTNVNKKNLLISNSWSIIADFVSCANSATLAANVTDDWTPTFSQSMKAR